MMAKVCCLNILKHYDLYYYAGVCVLVGHCGTVVEIGKPGSKTSPDKTVVVQWDSGSRTNYRVGYQGKFDLRIFDNGPIGVRHPNVICDNCKKRGIQGMRWYLFFVFFSYLTKIMSANICLIKNKIGNVQNVLILIYVLIATWQINMTEIINS